MLSLGPFPEFPCSFPQYFPYTRKVEVAIQAVREACQAVKLIRAAPALWVGNKPDGSKVTTGDFVSQVVLAKRISRAFPSDQLLSEEDAECLSHFRDGIGEVFRWLQAIDPDMKHRGHVESWIRRGRGYVGLSDGHWGCDPLDATEGYIQNDQYAINLHFVHRDEVKIGVIGCPNLRLACSPESSQGVLLVAVKGYGAWCCALRGDDQFHRLHVSSQPSIIGATGIRPPRDYYPNFFGEDIAMVKGFLTLISPAAVRRERSPIRYPLVASGAGDFLYHLSMACHVGDLYVHDHAAGALLVAEAGGRVTDFLGHRLDPSGGLYLDRNFGVVASNGFLHKELVDTFAASIGLDPFDDDWEDD